MSVGTMKRALGRVSWSLPSAVLAWSLAIVVGCDRFVVDSADLTAPTVPDPTNVIRLSISPPQLLFADGVTTIPVTAKVSSSSKQTFKLATSHGHFLAIGNPKEISVAGVPHGDSLAAAVTLALPNTINTVRLRASIGDFASEDSIPATSFTRREPSSIARVEAGPFGTSATGNRVSRVAARLTADTGKVTSGHTVTFRVSQPVATPAGVVWVDLTTKNATSDVNQHAAFDLVVHHRDVLPGNADSLFVVTASTSRNAGQPLPPRSDTVKFRRGG